MAGRNGTLKGQTVRLHVKFQDPIGNLVDPDTSPFVDIFPAGKDPNQGSTTDADALVLNASQTSLGTPPGSHLIIREGVGCYYYDFDIGLSADIGIWFDRWTATITGQTIEEVFMFAVVGGGSIGTSQLFNNNRVTVTIDSELLDTDNNPLGADFSWYFTTTYNPLYSSTRRLRMELGPLINNIPDDTINLAIFEASLIADALTFRAGSGEYFEFARKEYVTCLAGSFLLGGTNSAGKSKRLADLQIEFTGNPASKLTKLESCLGKWDHVLRSGGELGSETSLKPQSFVKGQFDPERPNVGRLWDESTLDPAANTKITPRGKTRSKATFLSRWGKRWGR